MQKLRRKKLDQPNKAATSVTPPVTHKLPFSVTPGVTREVEVERELTTPQIPPAPKALEKKPARPPHWSEPHGSRLKQLDGCPSGGPWSFIGKLAQEYTKLNVLAALAKSSSVPFTNWQHATGWLTLQCQQARTTGNTRGELPVSAEYRNPNLGQDIKVWRPENDTGAS
jgi:hypothetical protein